LGVKVKVKGKINSSINFTRSLISFRRHCIVPNNALETNVSKHEQNIGK